MHLEGATNSDETERRIARVHEQQRQLARGEISIDEFFLAMHVQPWLDSRWHGSALYVAHEGRRYLLTAQHVIIDRVGGRREHARRIEDERRRLADYPDALAASLEHIGNEPQLRAFPYIFRIPSLDEHNRGGGSLVSNLARQRLMGLDAGTPSTLPYLCWDEADLAVISLDARFPQFADELDAVGQVPVSLEDFADAPDHEGQELFAVGFPEAMAIVHEMELPGGLSSHMSAAISLPVSSFGRVAMLHETLPFFLADISIYPGNSGGPVVAENRLVGIVSTQPTVPLEAPPGSAMSAVTSRIPFGWIAKAHKCRELLLGLAQREQAFRDSLRPG